MSSELEKLRRLHQRLNKIPTSADIDGEDVSRCKLVREYGGIYNARVEAGIHPDYEPMLLRHVENNGPIKFAQIAESFNVSRHFLQKPFEKLKDDNKIYSINGDACIRVWDVV